MSGGDVLAVSVDLAGLDASLAENACFTAGALAVSYSDTRDDAILEPAPGEFRLWPAPRMQATFASGSEPVLLRAVLSAALGIAPARLEFSWLSDRAWEREWLKDWKAMRFGQRLWVCPAHESVSASDAVVLTLDPGLAFGTGTHPTTSLCLEWLDAHPPRGLDVIDYGCGSGILALAALQLGARHAWCHDIDSQALTATADNARLNAMHDRITLVSEAVELPHQVDVLLANILSGPLQELAPSLAARVRPDGCIVLAGLLSEQAGEVGAAYAPWFSVASVGQRDGWTCLSGTRLAGKAVSLPDA